jgi:uncharacterized membrane protein YcgQ (UPF0703/DUF1980 family)
LDGELNDWEEKEMKKVIAMLAAILLIALSGCQKAPVNVSAKNGNGTPALGAQSVTPTAPVPQAVSTADDTGVIEIREKMFVAQTNEIYVNAPDYLGRAIKYEGIFQAYTWEENGVTYRSVIRYGPGCCGTDANCGFEVIWDGEYPEIDDWVEAVGVLEEYDEDGNIYLRLALTSLTVLDTRGEEYVEQ